MANRAAKSEERQVSRVLATELELGSAARDAWSYFLEVAREVLAAHQGRVARRGG